VFEKRMLRRIFGPMRDEVTGVWRKLLSNDLRNFTLRRVYLDWPNEEG
jgi:hypothetical protein